MTTLVGSSAYRGFLGSGTPDATSWFRGDGSWQYVLDISNASGGQIKFPTTQNSSSDVNTLDDYEEGTFTPTIASSGGGAPVYSVQVGTYTKIGDRVIFQLRVVISSTGTLAAGTITIAGLPFTSFSTANVFCACTGNGNFLSAGTTTQVIFTILNSSSTISVARYDSGSATALSNTNLTNSTLFNVSGAYQV